MSSASVFNGATESESENEDGDKTFDPSKYPEDADAVRKYIDESLDNPCADVFSINVSHLKSIFDKLAATPAGVDLHTFVALLRAFVYVPDDVTDDAERSKQAKELLNSFLRQWKEPASATVRLVARPSLQTKKRSTKGKASFLANLTALVGATKATNYVETNSTDSQSALVAWETEASGKVNFLVINTPKGLTDPKDFCNMQRVGSAAKI